MLMVARRTCWRRPCWRRVAMALRALAALALLLLLCGARGDVVSPKRWVVRHGFGR